MNNGEEILEDRPGALWPRARKRSKPGDKSVQLAPVHLGREDSVLSCSVGECLFDEAEVGRIGVESELRVPPRFKPLPAEVLLRLTDEVRCLERLSQQPGLPVLGVVAIKQQRRGIVTTHDAPRSNDFVVMVPHGHEMAPSHGFRLATR